MQTTESRAIAHSANDDGQMHNLEDHLKSVSDLARRFAGPLGLSEVAAMAGAYHDLGKYNTAWQRWIVNQSGEHPNHSDVGAALFADRSDLLSMVIHGHHTKLRSPTDIAADLRKLTDPKSPQDVLRLQTSRKKAAEEGIDINQEIPQVCSGEIPSDHRSEMKTRLLYSCLLDADFLDTEAHFKPAHSHLRENAYHSLEEYQSCLMQHLAGLPGKADASVDTLRAEVLAACLQSAEKEPGFYRLCAPTGSGKTFASLAFALYHATKWNKKRVIYVAPYTSIVDQTASEFRKVFKEFGEHAVLEHHSALTRDRDSEWNRLASENWDAPLIVTTGVQFFESLHANKPSACRKLHNIADSIVIVDEVQTIPVGLWRPVVEAMVDVFHLARTTFLWMTATQPPWHTLDPKWKVPEVHEIAPDAKKWFLGAKRISYQRLGVEKPLTRLELMDRLMKHDQVLTVTNLRAQAIRLGKDLIEATGSEDHIYVLTTYLAPDHRRRQLNRIREALEEKRPCRVISTNLIEAGVDLDFPVGYRIVGPLTSNVQTGGRVNRSGKRKDAILYIVNYKEEEEKGKGKGLPGDLGTGVKVTEGVLAYENIDWDDPRLYEKYLKQYFDASTDARKRGDGVHQARNMMDFEKVSELFRMISDETHPVLVSPVWLKEEPDDLEELRKYQAALDVRSKGQIREALRVLQPFTVNLRPYEYKKCYHEGMILPRLIGGEDGIEFSEWHGGYSQIYGLAKDGVPMEPLVF